MKKITLFLFMFSLLAFSGLEAQITTFPYTEDFESGDGGWVADNTGNGTWALGTPAGAIINSAASGDNSWVTNLTGTYNVNEDSWVTSPVFDFSSLSAPSIELSIWYDAEFSWDGAVLQSSIDGGTTWVNVGANGDSNNWFNDGTIGGNPGGQQEGWSGTGAGGTNAWVTARHALTGLAGETSVIFRIAFGSDGSVVDDGFGFDDINIFEVTCPEPTALTASNINSSDAVLSWTESGSSNDWNIEVVTSGTPPTGTPSESNVSNPYTVSGLSAVTSYDFYVQSNCGSGSSSWVGPFTFTTTCDVYTPDYLEQFDTIIPDCWDEADSGDATTGPGDFGAGAWGNDGFLNDGFTGAYKINLWQANKSDWILSPQFDLTGGPFQVEFDFGIMQFGSSTNAGTLGSDDTVQLLITNDGGTTWTPLVTYDNTSTVPATGAHPVVTLEAYAGQTVQFGILGSEGTVDDTEDNDVFVDNFRVRNIPTCPEPTDLSVANITADGAELSWTENGSAVEYNIEIVESGTPPTGTPTATDVGNPYSVSGLNPVTSYDFYVQAICGTSDLSSWTGPISFETLCDVFVPDYLQQFDTIIPDCWDEADSGDATTGPGDLGAGAWAADGFLNDGFTGAYKINLWQASKSDWILSPQFDLTGGPFQVEFDFGIMQFGSSTNAGTLGSDDTVQLLITNDGGATWTTLLTYDNTSAVPATGAHPVVTLEAYVGQTVQFGILASEGSVDDTEDNDVFVDNFRVRGIPTCPEPTDLTSNNLSLTSTEVGWTETGTADTWNIEYGPDGFVPGTGTLVTGVTTNPFALEGLTSDTDYDFYVQAECDPTNLSSFSGPGSFYTGYCQSEPTSNDGQGVSNVTIGFTDFPSFGDVTYEDHTSPTVNVFQGIDTNVAVTFATGFTYGTNIWIDFNDNLVFEDTELVFSGESTNANPTTLDASFVMPLTAPIGVHRMRIGTADSGQATPNPCYNGSWGVTLDFTVNIQELTCTLPEANYSVITDCDTNEFYIEVDVTDMGDASSIEISNDYDASTVPVPTADVYQAGPFPFGNSVKVFVANNDDNNCTISSESFEVLACPPSNDDCINATEASVNPGESCESVTPGTILAATPSGIPDGSCGGNPDDDVWFQFVAAGDQQIIDLQNITGGTTNLDHALYSGDCGNLVELYCSDDTYSITSALTIGQTYYIRVFSAGSSAETSTFDLCISTIGTPTYCLDALPICADPTIQYESIVGDQTAPPYLDYDCLGSQPDPQWNTINIDIAGDYVFSLDQVDLSGNPIDIDFIVWGPFVNQQGGCVDLLPETIADCSYSATASETITLTDVPENSVYVILITNFSQDPGYYVFSQDSGPPDGTNCDVVCDVTLSIEGGEVEDDVEDPITPDETFEFCGYESVELTADTFYSVEEYRWYENGFIIPDYNQPNLTVTESGTYQVQVLGGICDQSETYFSALIDVKLYDEAPTVDSQNITVCDGPGSDGVEEFDLGALTASLDLGEDFVVSYHTSIDNANQAIDPVGPLYTSAGETLFMRIQDADAYNDGYLGCQSNPYPEVELVVNPRPIANQPEDFVVCDDTDGTVDGTTQFDLTSINDEVSTDANVTITYHTSQDDAENNAAALTSPYTSSGETVYVRVEDNNTGCYETTSFNLEVNLVPLASFDQQFEYVVCPNATTPITIGIVPENFTASDVSVTWSLDGALIAGASGLTLNSVLVSGDYTADITFNDTECTNSLTVFVEEAETCIFPEGISPNNDDLNDNFDLSSFNVVKLEIFNRNGTLVYSKNNYVDEWFGQTN
ncbi:fibronectin type III domain-containing protein, partial [Winogradskyella marincola]